MNTIINDSLEDGFEKDLYRAAHYNLADQTNPLRLNNFAYIMRELVRHLLERLAPDDSVRACSWYENEVPNEENKVTRRQKATYAIQGGLSNDYIQEKLGIETQEIYQSLIREIKDLNKYTHVEPHTFGISQAETIKIANSVEAAVVDLLHTIKRCRSQISYAISQHTDQVIFNESIEETITSLDDLATHHYIDYITTEEVEVISITHDQIRFKVSGSIDVVLQWGSDSDLRNDIGATSKESFPFRCLIWSKVDSIETLNVIRQSLRINLDSWYGTDEEEMYIYSEQPHLLSLKDRILRVINRISAFLKKLFIR